MKVIIGLNPAPGDLESNFKKVGSWSPRASFIRIISTYRINEIKKGKLLEKVKFYANKKILYIF